MAESDDAAPGGAKAAREPRAGGERASASAGRYRALVDAADDAILFADFHGLSVLEANQAACELFGYGPDEFTGRSVIALHPTGDPDVAGVFEEIRCRERAWHQNLRACRKDGTTFWSELRAKVFESEGQKLVLFIIRDVSHRVEREAELNRAYDSLKEAQARVVHAGKLAAIGQIAGGVAHEVNNPATFILTNLRVMRDHVGQVRRAVAKLTRELVDEPALPPERQAVVEGVLVGSEPEALLRETQEMIEDNLSGIERIASIVKDLRTFSRIEQEDVQEVRVNDLVDVACNLAFAHVRHRARLIKQLTRLPRVSGEPGKLAQVFTTLLVTAADGIAAGQVGDHEIRVTTSVHGGQVVVTIQDSAPAFTEEERARLFEPFFTTKRETSGLGLSLCSEIVRMHGGTISVSSPAGRGNRFEVRLPTLEEPAARADGVRARAPQPAASRARVLVIDDDVAVLRAYRRMLGSRHDVVLASGGAEGLDILYKDPGFDIVLCDVMMPQVDGPMVYEALAERLPAVAARLVFCSGGAFTPRAKEFLASVRNQYLSKPIDATAIDTAIASVRARTAG